MYQQPNDNISSSPDRPAGAFGNLPLVALTSLFLLMGGGCDSGKQAAVAAPPPGVLVARVTQREVSKTTEYVGRTVAVNDVSIRAQVEGYLLERRFEEGEDIEQGSELFLIDPALYEAAVAAAEGEVAQAQAEVTRADKDLKRYKTLLKKQSVSQQKVDEAESDKLQASANLKSANAKLLKTQIDLSHTIMKAPISGRIGRARSSVGDLVTPLTGELARLVEIDPIYANFSVSERDVIAYKRRIAQGREQTDVDELEVRLRLPDGSVYEHVGHVDFIDNVVDGKTGTVVLRARFDNPNKLLVPGLYVSTMLGSKETSEVLVIPQSAVQENQAGKFVMVVGSDNKVEQRRIETGRTYAGELEVASGLDPDEQVIVEGIQKVRPGLVVVPKMAPRPSMQRENTDSNKQAAEGPAVTSEPEAVSPPAEAGENKTGTEGQDQPQSEQDVADPSDNETDTPTAQPQNADAETRER